MARDKPRSRVSNTNRVSVSVTSTSDSPGPSPESPQAHSQSSETEPSEELHELLASPRHSRSSSSFSDTNENNPSGRYLYGGLCALTFSLVLAFASHYIYGHGICVGTGIVLLLTSGGWNLVFFFLTELVNSSVFLKLNFKFTLNLLN